jgi:hypothetical protein
MRPIKRLISPFRCPLDNTLPGSIMGKNIL